MTKIIDCFPFFDEFMILDIRFRELYDVVDKFIIVEADETFTGIPKPLYLTKCIEERYPQYLDKIEIIIAPARHFDNAWDREFFQKNYLCKENLRHLKLADDDLILLSDADEIPRRDAIIDMKENGFNPLGGILAGPMFYYKLNVLTSENWVKVKYTPYKDFTNHTEHRFRAESNLIKNAIWHFSYLKSPEDIKKKIESFSHQEFNNEQYNTVSKIEEKVETYSDLFGRPEITLQVVPIDDSFPEYVKENTEQLKDWIA